MAYVKNKTQELCLEAVKQNGTAINFIKEQTIELCLEAVKQNGLALACINEHTPEICLEAVKQNGYAIQSAKKYTQEICLEAIKQFGELLQFIPGGILNKKEHFIFEGPNARKVFINNIDEKWLFSVGNKNNITKDEFIDRIYKTDGGLKKNPHRQIYLDFLENF